MRSAAVRSRKVKDDSDSEGDGAVDGSDGDDKENDRVNAPSARGGGKGKAAADPKRPVAGAARRTRA